MHVKVGDTVNVLAGKDKGKISEVTSVIKHNNTIMLKDINLKTKRVKSKEEGEQGQIIEDSGWEETQDGVLETRRILYIQLVLHHIADLHKYLEAMAKAFDKDQEDDYKDDLLRTADPLSESLKHAIELVLRERGK